MAEAGRCELLVSGRVSTYISSQMGVSKNNGTPKSSILIGFSTIFTIHFGGKIPLFLEVQLTSTKPSSFTKPSPGSSLMLNRCNASHGAVHVGAELRLTHRFGDMVCKGDMGFLCCFLLFICKGNSDES